MARAGGLEAYEMEATGNQPADPPAPGPQQPASRRLTLTVTPLGAFAAGTLLASALALAWTLGRRMPPEPPPRTSGAAASLDEVRRLPPIPYDELPVDQGLAD